MRVTVIGTGYVGLVTGACLSDVGNDVLCIDIDADKISKLQRGEIPIYEPGLDKVVSRNSAIGRLRFSSDTEEAVRFGQIQIIAVGTPPSEDGSADLRHVLAAARNIAACMDDYKVIVNKSTVPVGTADLVKRTVREGLQRRGVDLPFAVVSNPEFMKEGAALEDFFKPDRVVLGVADARAERLMRLLYAPFQRSRERTIVMSPRSAELTKYAANAMLATRISFMNEMANLAECVGADIEDVRQGIGADPRIGYAFLYAGIGYGGSCFPKDVRALTSAANKLGMEMAILRSVDAVNEFQKQRLVEKLEQRLGKLDGCRVALWGLAFKPGTDDMREAPSRVIVERLLAQGANVTAYDPVAADEAARVFASAERLQISATAMEAVRGADALLIATEWKEFRSPDFDAMREVMRQPLIFDGRNVFDPALVAEMGFEYFGMGRAATSDVV